MDKNYLLLEQWKMASELHRHEDRHSWQRFQYYITLTGILVSAIGVIWTAKTIDAEAIKTAFIIISVFGAVTSFVFALIYKRSWVYHKYHIARAKETEEKLKVDDQRVLTLYEKELKLQSLMGYLF